MFLTKGVIPLNKFLKEHNISKKIAENYIKELDIKTSWVKTRKGTFLRFVIIITS